MLTIESTTDLRVEGRLDAPSDKSLTQRALLFALLARGTSRIRRPLHLV